MLKETIICIIIITLIIFGEIVTQKYTENVVNSLNSDLKELKGLIISKSDSKAIEEINNIHEKINSKNEILAYYMEHDELEKIETNFTSCKIFVEHREYNLALNELEKTIFVLEHLTDKYSFNLDNIF